MRETNFIRSKLIPNFKTIIYVTLTQFFINSKSVVYYQKSNSIIFHFKKTN